MGRGLFGFGRGQIGDPLQEQFNIADMAHWRAKLATEIAPNRLSPALARIDAILRWITLAALSISFCMILSFSASAAFTPYSLPTKPLPACSHIPPRSPPPLTVDDLHPSDIRHLVLLGDSIGEGFGIQGLASGVNAFKGCSAFTGSDPGCISVFNLVSNAGNASASSARLIGGSRKHRPAWLANDSGVFVPGNRVEEIDGLNFAQTGARSTGLENEIEHLRRAWIDLRASREDWTMIVIDIGANDVCAAHRRDVAVVEQEFRASLINALQSLILLIPRATVHLMSVPDIPLVTSKASEMPPWEQLSYSSIEFALRARFIPILFPSICPILFTSYDEAAFVKTHEIIHSLNRILEQVSRMPQFQTREFAVRIIPPVPSHDYTQNVRQYLSALDFFHPTVKTHEILAEHTYRCIIGEELPATTMQKERDAMPIPCPTERTRLVTRPR